MESPDDYEAPGIELREYLHLVLNYKWLVLAGIAAGMTLGIFYGKSRPEFYHASASVLINAEAPRVLGRGVEQAVEYGANSWSADRSTFYNSQLSIMRSQAVAELSVTEGKLTEIPEVAGTGTPAQRYRAALVAVRSSVSVSLAPQERLVWVRATHKNPVAAAAVANALVAGYQAFNLDRYRSGNAHATEWLSGELDAVETELADANAAVMDFTKQNDLLSFSLEDRRSLLGRRIAHYSEAATSAKTERIALELSYKKIAEAGKTEIADSSIFDIANSATGRALRERYIAATIELESLSASLGPRHPNRLEQVERVAKSKTALEDEARVVITAANDRYKKAVRLEARLNAELEDLKQQAFALGPKEIEHNTLVRKRQEAEARARHLRERYNENNMAGRLQTTNVRPLDKAFVPGRSGKKKWSFYMGIAGMAGLMMSVGLILLVHQLDSRVHRVGEIEELAGSGFLGALPVMADSDRTKAKELGRFQEAIRIIRTNLSFLAPDVSKRTLMITSPQPRDGKSTTAYYMAVSLAQVGKRVLLIDADMRNPSLHRIVGIQRNEGLSELIVGEIEEEQAIRSTEHDNVSLIPAGRSIRDPAESVASQRFASMLDRLHERFDVIIIDTPPVLPVADATVMCRVADVALVIGRCGNTEKAALGVALAQLRRANPSSLGVIANAAGAGTSRYYYKGYDSSAYDYGLAPDIGLDPQTGEGSHS